MVVIYCYLIGPMIYYFIGLTKRVFSMNFSGVQIILVIKHAISWAAIPIPHS